MATGRLLYAASLLSLVLPTTLAAQTVATAEDPIVVEARRVKSANDDVRSVATSYADQFSRFDDPICPRAVGFPATAAGQVEDRIRAIATRIGARVDKPGCSPNLIVVATGHGNEFVNKLYKRRPRYFAALSPRQIQALRASPGPAWTWQIVAPKRADGAPVQRVSSIDFGEGPVAVAYGATVVQGFSEASRLSVPTRQDTEAAFVVLDIARMDRLNLLQIADYAAVAGLASVRTGRADHLSRRSILTLFDDRTAGREGATEATPFDIAYLSGLYAGSANRSASQKAQEIAIRIGHDPDAR